MSEAVGVSAVLEVDSPVLPPAFTVNDESGAAACPICGRPLPLRLGRRGKRREKHEECRQFSGYLAAAIRALRAIHFASDEDRAKARRALLAAANGLPADWRRPRDGRGRFVGSEYRRKSSAPAAAG